MLQPIRKFSTSSVQRQLFAVIARDHPGEEGLQRRLSVRNEHIGKAKEAHEHGTLKMGGALLDSHENGKMLGSLLVIEADSLEKAKAFVESDIYVRGNVWKSWEIVPYKGAFGVK
ncbi:uncharacterized protein BX664DRAFT_328408 [Halteromyces radiatus]|uniref:uncharacterized protein n=1 Tax=Halteromyces radiatus TaxID=101107 RepID=UPI00221FD6E2|nr:uncharacterized protein BX664DRAFT_328408 [Halteromyces radiatus]KAI8092890.1 hypothetical protein BX664DRAFT_328408 [Halteromyces radiatus]